MNCINRYKHLFLNIYWQRQSQWVMDAYWFIEMNIKVQWNSDLFINSMKLSVPTILWIYIALSVSIQLIKYCLISSKCRDIPGQEISRAVIVHAIWI